MQQEDNNDSDEACIQQNSVHLDDKEGHSMQYNCRYCDITFSSIEDHIREFHENEDVLVEVEEDVAETYGFEEVYCDPEDDPSGYECNICATILKSAKSLKMHMKIHDAKKCYESLPPHKSSEYLCEVCNRSFNSNEHLGLHMGAHANGTFDNIVQSSTKETGYPCAFCGRRFKRPYEKVKHERIHTGEKPYACTVCGKRFRVSSSLAIHRRTHDDSRPFVCPHCKKRFKVLSAYDHHLKIHSENRDYHCSFCSKSFKTAVQLNGHKKSHTKPFSCSECQRPFGSLYAVRKHMEVHQLAGNRLSYSCDICGANYGREFALRDHRKQHHATETVSDQSEDDDRVEVSSLGETVEISTTTGMVEEVSESDIIEEELLF